MNEESFSVRGCVRVPARNYTHPHVYTQAPLLSVSARALSLSLLLTPRRTSPAPRTLSGCGTNAAPLLRRLPAWRLRARLLPLRARLAPTCAPLPTLNYANSSLQARVGFFGHLCWQHVAARFPAHHRPRSTMPTASCKRA